MTPEQKIDKVLTLLKNRKIVVFDTGEQCLDRFTVIHNKYYDFEDSVYNAYSSQPLFNIKRKYGVYVACSANGGFYQHGEFSNFKEFVKDLVSNPDFTRLTSTTDFTQVFSSETLLDFYNSFL